MGCVFQAGEIGAWISLLFLLKKIFLKFFTQRIIALQCCAGFCHTTTLIGHNYLYVCKFPSLLLPPSPLPFYPLGHHRVPGWASWATQQLPTCWLFYIPQCTYVSATFSICPTFFPFNQGPASIFCTFYLKAILSIKMGALYII